MNLNPIGSNQTEVTTDSCRILFSYKTPVACYHPKRGYVVTEKKWSVTTSRHINKWLDGNLAETAPQSWFDTLA